MNNIQVTKTIKLLNYGNSTNLQDLKEFIAKIEEQKAKMNLKHPEAFSNIQFETEEASCVNSDCERQYLETTCNMFWEVPDGAVNKEGDFIMNE